ncbi:MAG: Rpn family recombination-promoting nuclease/putative transposase [Lachnospiraceae bacterium]|nr:Rpn family recombination-promoting nuclease/putative transposase [Lachnospiraceae bacterium]
MEKKKNYEELTIRDHFMFGKICSKPEIRKLILDSLLQIDLQEKYGEIEKQIREFKDAKYARLDLLVEDEKGAVYDTEMQNKSKDRARQDELPKRGRYYQSIIDTSYANSGEEYLNLPELFIVFICTYDPFGENLPIYTFESKCLEKETIKYDEKVHKIFFNTTADLSCLPQNMKNMLEYINTGATNDKATELIDEEVKEARLKEEWRAEYMLTVVHDKDVYRDGFEDGKEQGIEQGTFTTTINLIKNLMESLEITFDEACDKLCIKDKEIYRSHI